MKKLLLIFTVLVLINQFIKSQIEASIYTDFGHNQVSEGLFLKSAVIGKYTFNKFDVEAGIENEIISSEAKLISAWSLGFGREISINNFDIYAKAFFINQPFSEFVRQTNWGFLASTAYKHFGLKLGTNFRKYSSNGSDVFENGNLMYDICYYLKADDHAWNTGISLTNFDDFVIHQETNPMLKLVGKYAFNDKLTWEIELWYITAGAFNLHVNYFGTFLRTGIQWKIR